MTAQTDARPRDQAARLRALARADEPPMSMEFRVGGWNWTLTIARGLYLSGEPCMGKACQRTRTIKIAADVPPAGRLEVLLHELWHAWAWTLRGEPGIEEQCQLFAMAAASAWRDLEAQGGVETLMAMVPVEQSSLASLLCRWHAFADALDHPDVELDADTFAPVAATYEELRERGHVIDPTLDALMRHLTAQLADARPPCRARWGVPDGPAG